MSGWQPIETIPREPGTCVLVFYPKVGRKMHEQEYMTFSNGFISEYQWRQPTHWRFPPEPAEVESAP